MLARVVEYIRWRNSRPHRLVAIDSHLDAFELATAVGGVEDSKRAKDLRDDVIRSLAEARKDTAEEADRPTPTADGLLRRIESIKEILAARFK